MGEDVQWCFSSLDRNIEFSVQFLTKDQFIQTVVPLCLVESKSSLITGEWEAMSDGCVRADLRQLEEQLVLVQRQLRGDRREEAGEQRGGGARRLVHLVSLFDTVAFLLMWSFFDIKKCS